MNETHLIVVGWCFQSIPQNFDKLATNDASLWCFDWLDVRIDYDAKPLSFVNLDSIEDLRPQIRNCSRLGALGNSIPRLKLRCF